MDFLNGLSEIDAATTEVLFWKTSSIQLQDLSLEDNVWESNSFDPDYPMISFMYFPFKGMDDKNATKLNELIQVG